MKINCSLKLLKLAQIIQSSIITNSFLVVELLILNTLLFCQGKKCLLKGRGLSITSMVILYVSPSAYFIPCSSELRLHISLSRAEWKHRAKSFIGSKHFVAFKSLLAGQQPTGGTLMMPNLRAPRLYKVCYIANVVLASDKCHFRVSAYAC